jgi:hypothetical protein
MIYSGVWDILEVEIGLMARLRNVEEGCEAMSGNICTAEVGQGTKRANQVIASLTSPLIQYTLMTNIEAKISFAVCCSS